MRLAGYEVERKALKPVTEHREISNFNGCDIKLQVILGVLVGHKECDVRVIALLGPERVSEPVRVPLAENKSRRRLFARTPLFPFRRWPPASSKRIHSRPHLVHPRR